MSSNFLTRASGPCII